MSVADEIFEQAAHFTQVYAQGLQPGLPAAIVPGRVHVLLRDGIVLGVLGTWDRAVEEAHDLMAAGGTWQELRAGLWRSDSDNLLTISTHDVR